MWTDPIGGISDPKEIGTGRVDFSVTHRKRTERSRKRVRDHRSGIVDEMLLRRYRANLPSLTIVILALFVSLLDASSGDRLDEFVLCKTEW
jgi:hypothetical protein